MTKNITQPLELLLNYKAREVENALCCPDSSVLPHSDTVLPRPQDDGIQMLEGVLNDLRSALRKKGNCHCDVGHAWNALGLVRIHMQKDVAKALESHQQALKIYQDNSNHTETAVTLNDIGFCYEKMGQTGNALSCYQEALRLFKQAKFSKGHTRIIATERGISRIQRT